MDGYEVRGAEQLPAEPVELDRPLYRPGGLARRANMKRSKVKKVRFGRETALRMGRKCYGTWLLQGMGLSEMVSFNVPRWADLGFPRRSLNVYWPRPSGLGTGWEMKDRSRKPSQSLGKFSKYLKNIKINSESRPEMGNEVQIATYRAFRSTFSGGAHLPGRPPAAGRPAPIVGAGVVYPPERLLDTDLFE